MKEASVLYGPDTMYSRYLAQGSLHLQRCGNCSEFFFPPRMLCPHCSSTSYSWQAVSGTGTIYSSTFVNAAGKDEGGHAVAIVRLAEGPKLMGSAPQVTVQDSRIGAKVRAFIQPFESSYRLSFLIDET